MSIGMVMNYDDKFKSIADVTLSNRRRYADKRGYTLCESHHEGAWGKINAILDNWSKFDWLWWLDADACITNEDEYLGDIIWRCRRSVIISCDHNGINTGSMLLETEPHVKQVLETVLKNRSQWDFEKSMNEQTGLAYMLWTINKEVVIVPQRTFNSYPDTWVEGDFVLHCPGYSESDRIELLSKALA